MLAKLQIAAVAVAVTGAAAFGAGWSINGWRLEARFAEAQIVAIEEYKRQNEILMQEHAEQVERDTTARIALRATIRESDAKARQLQASLKAATLAKPLPQILTVEGECNAQVDHNPISSEFIRLWNDSARSVTTD